MTMDKIKMAMYRYQLDYLVYVLHIHYGTVPVPGTDEVSLSNI